MKKDLQETHRWRGRNWNSLLPSPFLQMLFLLGVFWGSGLAKLYIVPGHFQRLIEAIVSVRDGDTVAIRPTVPGHVPYEPGIYHWGRKQVVVGIWEVGTPTPREGLITSNVHIYPENTYAPLDDEDTTGYWMPQERLTEVDTFADAMAHPFYDPVRNWYWVPWHTGSPGWWEYFDDVVKWYDFNTGEWSRIYDVTGSYEEGDSFPDFRIYGMVDTQGRVWLSWDRETDNATFDHDEMYRTYDENGWGPIGYVDSSHYYMSSIYIADAGGEIWAIQNKLIEDPPGSNWWSHETFARRYENGHFGDSIWISHQGWGTDETVGHATHDRFGRIHVVWQEYWTAGVFYRQYSNGTWHPIRLVNDTTWLGGSGWGEWVAVDSLTGRIYVVFSGFLKNQPYNQNTYITWSDDDGVSWSEPIRVNEVTSGNEYYPTIAIRDTADFWVFWYREYSWVNAHVWTRHYLSGTWYPEVQLDDSTSPSLSPWGNNVPGGIWITFTGGYGNLIDPFDLWLVRFVYVGVGEEVMEINSPLTMSYRGEDLWLIGEVGLRGKVSVYDVAGRFKGILWSGHLSQGKVRIRWSPRWRSGVYFVVLESERHRRLLKVFRVSR